MPRSTILGTIVVERVVDTVVLVAIASIAILVLSVRGIVASAVLVGLAVTALLIVAIAIGMAAHRLPGAERVAAFLARWPQVIEMLARLREGLAIATKAGTIGRALVLTLLAWGCSILAFTAGAQAVGIQPTMGQAALLAAGTEPRDGDPCRAGLRGHVRARRRHDRRVRRHLARRRAGHGGARPRVLVAAHVHRRRDRVRARAPPAARPRGDHRTGTRGRRRRTGFRHPTRSRPAPAPEPARSRESRRPRADRGLRVRGEDVAT